MDGAMLHFKSADGVFDEMVPGAVTVAASPFLSSLFFDGIVTTPLSGSYDITPLTQGHPHERVQLHTPLGYEDRNDVPGYLVVVPEQGGSELSVATWDVSGGSAISYGADGPSLGGQGGDSPGGLGGVMIAQGGGISGSGIGGGNDEAIGGAGGVAGQQIGGSGGASGADASGSARPGEAGVSGDSN